VAFFCLRRTLRDPKLQPAVAPTVRRERYGKVPWIALDSANAGRRLKASATVLLDRTSLGCLAVQARHRLESPGSAAHDIGHRNRLHWTRPELANETLAHPHAPSFSWPVSSHRDGWLIDIDH
jgi:hypothetical protein